jgi:hypothetical protein
MTRATTGEVRVNGGHEALDNYTRVPVLMLMWQTTIENP